MRTTVSAEVDAKQPKAPSEYGIQNLTSVLYGYLPSDGLYLPDLLRRKTSHLAAGVEIIDGHPCDVIKGVTLHGTVMLWLDPTSRHAPIRLRLRKAGNDLMDKTPMRLHKAPGDDKESTPNLPLREFEFQVDYRTSLIDDTPLLSGYIRTDHFIYEGGADYSRRIEAELDHIRSVPMPRDLEPTLPIPEETPVRIRNAPGLRAKWSGGRLVMGYDVPTVATLEANWVSEPTPYAFWCRPWFLTTIGLLTLSAGVWVWQHRSK